MNLPNLSKAQELAILDDAIRKLGAESYLSAWLTQVRQEVESAIRSDVFPDILLLDSEARCKELITNAQSQASRILREAEAKAEKVRSSALKESEEIRLRLRRDIKTALQKLEAAETIIS